MATVVIIHRFFGGGWQWQQVRRGLEAAGHEVYGPTLTGMGERSHLASPDVDLDTHVQDVRNVLEYEDLHNVILVGNSYGGTLATILADQVPERLARVIHVDAVLPQDGECVLDIIPQPIWGELKERARVGGDGWRIPPGAGSNPRAAAVPLKAAQQPVRLTGGGRRAVPTVYIHCTVKPEVDICGPLGPPGAGVGLARGGVGSRPRAGGHGIDIEGTRGPRPPNYRRRGPVIRTHTPRKGWAAPEVTAGLLAPLRLGVNDEGSPLSLDFKIRMPQSGDEHLLFSAGADWRILELAGGPLSDSHTYPATGSGTRYHAVTGRSDGAGRPRWVAVQTSVR